MVYNISGEIVYCTIKPHVKFEHDFTQEKKDFFFHSLLTPRQPPLILKLRRQVKQAWVVMSST